MSRLALVVDDSMVIRHTIARFLESRGYQVKAAANGREALEVLARQVPGVIITDLQMPEMTGSELITLLKARSDTARIPIVVLAARGSARHQPETRAQFVIYKDIDIVDQLERAVSAVDQQLAAGS